MEQVEKDLRGVLSCGITSLAVLLLHSYTSVTQLKILSHDLSFLYMYIFDLNKSCHPINSDSPYRFGHCTCQLGVVSNSPFLLCMKPKWRGGSSCFPSHPSHCLTRVSTHLFFEIRSNVKTSCLCFLKTNQLERHFYGRQQFMLPVTCHTQRTDIPPIPLGKRCFDVIKQPHCACRDSIPSRLSVSDGPIMRKQWDLWHVVWASLRCLSPARSCRW